MTESPRASVVVPTRDRPAALRRCLAALALQTLAPLEVVVVDDGSRDAEAVARVVAESPPARLLIGRAAGPAAARNAGAAAAHGAVVCFTDDDCEPVPQWAERLLEPISAGTASAAVGRTVNGLPGDRLAAASQAIVTALTESSRDPATGAMGFGPSCNLAVAGEVFAGEPFDETFPLAAGEDREWCDRLRRRGRRIEFAGEAVVDHRPALSVGAFVRQHHRYGRGAQRFRRAASVRRRAHRAPHAPGALSRPRLNTEIFRGGFREGPAIGALVAAAQVLTAAGYASEALARPR